MRTPSHPPALPGLPRLLSCYLTLALLAASAGCGDSPEGPGGSGPEAGESAETVVLLHGLGRTHRSMEELAEQLSAAGYRVVNLSYPSRQGTPEELVEFLRSELAACCRDRPGPVHFVTHSLGGILVRLLLAEAEPDPETAPPWLEVGRVVMLSPPNRGSEVVDALGETALFEAVMGPTAPALGTDPESLPNRLPPVDFELGVITGNRSLEPHLSWLIPGEDDGKVGVDRARVEGMADFLVVPASHPFIMGDPEVARQVEHFLAHGSFDHRRSDPEGPEDEPPASD